MSANSQLDWWIGLDGWILQDGNYADRVRQTGPASLRYTGRGATYEVVGQAIRAAAEPHGDAFVGAGSPSQRR